MTITLGLWIIPAVITVSGVVHISWPKSYDDYGIGAAIVLLGWTVAIVTSWLMWGLSWLT